MDKSQVRFHSCEQRVLDMMCLVLECMGLRLPVPWNYFEGLGMLQRKSVHLEKSS
jgi:hypothetical protein